MTLSVPVGLGTRAYEVLVGDSLLATAGERLAPFLKRGRTAVVSDETVWGLHGRQLSDSLARAGIEAFPVLVPPGSP